MNRNLFDVPTGISANCDYGLFDAHIVSMVFLARFF